MNAKKQARRDRAAKRFNILSMGDWDSARFSFDIMGRNPERRRAAPFDRLNSEYAAYIARKEQEAAALGI